MISTVILYFHRYIDKDIDYNDVNIRSRISRRNRTLENVEKYFGTTKMAQILSIISTYDGAGFWLKDQIINNISHKPKLLKEYYIKKITGVL